MLNCKLQIKEPRVMVNNIKKIKNSVQNINSVIEEDT